MDKSNVNNVEDNIEYRILKEKIIDFEHDMWEAAFTKDVDAFKELVSADAIMICGGGRCLGSEYAEFIRDFNISKYSISDTEIIHMSSTLVQLHYIVNVEVCESGFSDLAGRFHVVSLWKKTDDKWSLRFNMDSRVGYVQ